MEEFGHTGRVIPHGSRMGAGIIFRLIVASAVQKTINGEI
jgi:hypothetical protein